MNIGFIGLGIMGKPMARNLLRAGHRLSVYDYRQEPVQALCEDGATAACSAADAARNSEMVITMLPNSPHVREAVLGKDGVLQGAQQGTILADMSSIAPLEARAIAAACEARGVHMLDCPVSGGEPKAIEGTLSIMCGGEAEVFEQIRDVLLCMGSSAVRVGEIGSGNVAKLSNQIVVALNMAAVSEALTLAAKTGVDPQDVFEAIRGGLAGSTVLEAKAPMMLCHQFAPGFRMDLHIKDLKNVLDTAHAADVPLPLSAQVLEMMQAVKVDGGGTLDHSALALYYEKLAHVSLKGDGEVSGP